MATGQACANHFVNSDECATSNADPKPKGEKSNSGADRSILETKSVFVGSELVAPTLWTFHFAGHPPGPQQ